MTGKPVVVRYTTVWFPTEREFGLPRGTGSASADSASREAVATGAEKRWLPSVVGVFLCRCATSGADVATSIAVLETTDAVDRTVGSFVASYAPPVPYQLAMSVSDHVTAVVVNYQTPDLVDTAVRSFHRHYPNVGILLIDNGSQDESVDVIDNLTGDLGTSLTPLLLDENHHHGPAMHRAVRQVITPYVFFLDSDTETLRGGFLEEMTARSSSPNVYGAGKIVHANSRGFAAAKGVPVLVSAYMLIKCSVYNDLPPFIHHGLPALNNFTAAHRAGYELMPFPVDEYIHHFGRGTAERFGYGLGWRSRINYIMNRLGL